MAKVFIEETTLSAIGNAIREKTGKADLIDPANMSTEIASIEAGSGGGAEVEPLVLTGDCSYACSGPMAGTYISLFADTISTSAISEASFMFYKNTLSRIPFELNFASVSNSVGRTSMFQDCENLIYIPDIDSKSRGPYTKIFSGCSSLENLPQLTNAYPEACSEMFSFCSRLRYIPDDYFSTWNNASILSSTYAGGSSIFSGCYSLRKVPTSFFEFYSDGKSSTSSYVVYNKLFNNCYALDEVLNLPVVTLANLTSSSCTSSIVYYCNRLKRFTFKTNTDGTPVVARWKSQTLDFTNYVGTLPWSAPERIYNYNSGITADKEVIDDATYQALKNDPDWWTKHTDYSRYNHDSAVETINSLPDTSLFLSSGGTNTIRFQGSAGAKTDGGAINTLTEAEIAVAAAKGWTVTLS